MLSALIRTVRFFKTPRLAASWSAEFIDDRITTPRHKKHLDYYAERRLPVLEGIARATGLDMSVIEEQLNSLPNFLVAEDRDPGMTIRWSATTQLATTIYALIKLLKPAVVVETGVGAGVSSWTILHAMQENDLGGLTSIDLPTPNTQKLPEVGYLVPRELRHRWDLRTGPSRKLLPQVLGELGKIDLFLHDSRHSYTNQLREYRTAWPFIRAGGMLASDDVSNDALYEVSREWDREPSIIGQSKDAPIGLVRKP
ncbi:MAG: class I SAM-dependent methyltransferase [Chloroflexi bacterium]|nr:class I SAM-dependent methyltransferase [Chloroflexota bacterium]